jgi:hypothetical protein
LDTLIEVASMTLYEMALDPDQDLDEDYSRDWLRYRFSDGRIWRAEDNDAKKNFN